MHLGLVRKVFLRHTRSESHGLKALAKVDEEWAASQEKQHLEIAREPPYRIRYIAF